ncbi:AEC family transporter [Campylobacter troglodytis]|uniref:AEC family transporter n=1 Tax=Campylobacter troglodytis TaxID=654363 RepID=UPI00115C05A1|nr:AEC family transporter [Campylobacter troglodytis]TQR60857.1 AEC family transporter [Campylobacter troglodytis]
MFIFEPLFTIFALLMGGYFAKRVGVLKNRQSRGFLDFAVIFALPCLIFERTYYLNFNFLFVIYILIGLCSSLLAGLISVVLGKLFGFSRATLVSMFLLSSFGNTLFIGVPIIEGLYEDPQLISNVIFYDALATTLPMALFAPFVLSLASQQKPSLLTNIKKVLSFPPFVALILGLLCKLVSLPEFILEPIRLFGGAATPTALFAIGLGLGFNAIKTSYKSTFIVVSSKMLLTPFIFIALIALCGLEFSPSAVVAIFESSMPTMSLAVAMVMKAKLDSNLAVSVIAFGVLFAFISMPLLVFILI